MSYLDLPRLHISGRFFCDPSTVNNDPKHYQAEVTRPAPWQMPEGMHYFRFFDCTVKTALNVDGKKSTDEGLIGADVHSVNQPVPAKLVDVDVYQQAVTQIFGLDLKIDAGDEGSLVGRMRPPVLNGAWFKAVLPTRGWDPLYGSAGSYGEDSSALGVFQTVVEVKKSDWKFAPGGTMEVLRRSCSTETNKDGDVVHLLAFKFVLDGYWNIPGETLYQTGRMVGTLGPQFDSDPVETLGARWFEPRPVDPKAEWFVPQFYRLPFRVDEATNMLQIDWANGLPRQSFGGDPVELGEIEAVALTAKGPKSLGKFVVDERSYMMNSGITELPLSEKQMKRALKNPISLRISREDLGPQGLFSEAPSGLTVSTQGRTVRMTSDVGRATSKAEATVVIRKLGQPVAGAQPDIVVVPVDAGTPGATVPPGSPGDTPQASGALTASISATDENGIATIKFEAVEDPGSRTDQLDGQMYFVYVYFGDFKGATPPTQEQQVSVLVWSRFEVVENPEWTLIQEMMIPYAKLYPGMTQKFNVAKEDAFVFYSNNPAASFFVGPKAKYEIPGHPEIQDGAIPFYLSLPIEDPRYMPLTRDLSPPKIETIMNFISNEQAKIKARVAAEEAAEKKGGD